MANTVNILGDDECINQLIENEMVEFVDDTLITIGDHAFNNCSSLTTINLSAVTSIGSSAFASCTSLTKVILGNTSQVATLSNTNAFNSAMNAIIYVPDALASSYKSATNWSSLASRIKGLSELPEN